MTRQTVTARLSERPPFPYAPVLSVDFRDLPDDWRLCVTCPMCGAAIGEHCRTPSGRKHYNPAHYPRLSAIERVARDAVIAALTVKRR